MNLTPLWNPKYATGMLCYLPPHRFFSIFARVLGFAFSIGYYSSKTSPLWPRALPCFFLCFPLVSSFTLKILVFAQKNRFSVHPCLFSRILWTRSSLLGCKAADLLECSAVPTALCLRCTYLCLEACNLMKVLCWLPYFTWQPPEIATSLAIDWTEYKAISCLQQWWELTHYSWKRHNIITLRSTTR